MRRLLFAWVDAFAGRDARLTPEWRVGLLLGLGAALPGVVPVFLGLRPSHILVLAGLGLAVVVMARTGSWRTWRISAVEVLGLLFVATCVAIEIFNSVALNFSPSLISAALPLLYILGYAVTRQLLSAEASLDNFLSAFTTPAVIASFFGIAQALWPTATTWILLIAPSESASSRILEGLLTRATGLVGHWTGLGYYLCTMLVGLCILLILRRDTRRGYVFLGVAMAIVFGGVLSTLTLAPILTAGAIIIFTWFQLGMRPVRATLLGAATFAIVVALVLNVPGIQDRLEQQSTASSVVDTPEEAENTPGGPAAPSIDPDEDGSSIPAWLPSTIQWRLHIWQTETMPSIMERPWTGWGQELYSAARSTPEDRVLPQKLEWLSSESQVLWLAISFGIPAALIYLGMIVAAGVTLLRLLTRELRATILLVAGYLVLLLLGSALVPLFTNRGIPLSLWPLIGAVVGAAQVLHRQRAGAPVR